MKLKPGKVLIKGLTTVFISQIYIVHAQQIDPYKPCSNMPENYPGMALVWNEEFNYNGKPIDTCWTYETGFVRNGELQLYQKENAICKNGVLIIEAKKQKVKNPNFAKNSDKWTESREYANYTSACVTTQNKKHFKFGHFEIRARIPVDKGCWPAIWTLGIEKEWPSNGEIDIMEFYRIKDEPTLLANMAWGTSQRFIAKWDDAKIPLTHFLSKDTEWTKKFHIWRMDWTSDSICLYLDGELMNCTLISQTINADGSNPFLQPHYILLNLAIGQNGGNPDKTKFPLTYEIDYVRVYQKDPAMEIITK
ncbi:MAG: glycoside hydrolase family 16 protein [Bacteroidales bacterium]